MATHDTVRCVVRGDVTGRTGAAGGRTLKRVLSTIVVGSTLILGTTLALGTALAQSDPTVEIPASGNHPGVPSGLKVTCLKGPDTLDSSPTCPVLKWQGYTYWAYSYNDNRNAMGIVAYDLSGKVVKQWEKTPARYVWQVTVNQTAQNVTFFGQSNQTIVMTWAELGLPDQFGPSVMMGQKLQTADMTVNDPPVPGDIYRTSGSEGPDHKDLATFAWLEFIAMVAPAGPIRGGPNGSFADSGQDPSVPLVWETYQHRSELFPYNAAGGAVAPQPWDNPPKYVYQNSYVPPYGNYNNLDEATQIAQNLLYFPKDPGNPQPTTDWQTLFEAKVNQYEWGFVNQSSSPIVFPITLPAGTIEVKAAWRPIGSIPADQQYRYHTATIVFYEGDDDNPMAKTGVYALIALHIIHKTPNFPTFIFATFEQVDSLVNMATGDKTGLYYVPAYSTVSYMTPPTTTFLSGKQYTNPSIVLPNGSFSTAKPYAAPNGMLYKLPVGAVTTIAGAKEIFVADGTKEVVAVPVVQPPETNPDVDTVNSQALAAMKNIPGFSTNFVWQYYMLKGVQGVPTSDETANDYYLANFVVESSQPGIQLFRGTLSAGKPAPNLRNSVNVQDPKQNNNVFSVGGCQGCHGFNQTQKGFDFSFLFLGVNGSGFAPDTTGLKDAEEMKVLQQKYLTR